MSDAAGKAVAGIAGIGFVYYFPKIFTTLRDWEALPFIHSQAYKDREAECHFDITHTGFVYDAYDDGNPRRTLSPLAHGQTQQFVKPWPGGKQPDGYPHHLSNGH